MQDSLLTITPIKRTEVAVGILIRPDGALLFSTRPLGKAYAGYWEFPGGKMETGESVAQALQRELIEELGITISLEPGAAQVWKVTEHDYEHAKVRLHWVKVTAWVGEFEMREGQQVAWQPFNASVTPTVSPILSGAYPVLDWIAQERGLPLLVR